MCKTTDATSKEQLVSKNCLTLTMWNNINLRDQLAVNRAKRILTLSKLKKNEDIIDC